MRSPKTYYFVINSETRRHVLPGPKTTKYAAQAQLRREKQHGRSGFIVPIPADQVMAYHAAYLEQNGTLAHPK